MTAPTLLLLAAGSSSRMGAPKQLLDFRGEPMVRASARAALESALPVRVVVGCERDAVAAALAGLPVQVTEAVNWEQGLSASLAAGIEALEPSTPGVLVALADQPLIGGAHFRRLVSTWQDAPERIVATRYADGAAGVPALFGRNWFDTLVSLQGDHGAGQLLRETPGVLVLATDAELGDIDSPEDYRKLNTARDG